MRSIWLLMGWFGRYESGMTPLARPRRHRRIVAVPPSLPSLPWGIPNTSGGAVLWPGRGHLSSPGLLLAWADTLPSTHHEVRSAFVNGRGMTRRAGPRGTVEASNAAYFRSLRLRLDNGTHSRWRTLLPEGASAIRTATHSTTQASTCFVESWPHRSYRGDSREPPST